MSSTLLKLQIGPVQEFIAQARSTRDLWSGSYLISWMMGHLLHHLQARDKATEVIFPRLQGDASRLLEWIRDPELGCAEIAKAVTLSVIPNQLLAYVSSEIGKKEVQEIVDSVFGRDWTNRETKERSEWFRICSRCRQFLETEEDKLRQIVEGEPGRKFEPLHWELWDAQLWQFWRPTWALWPAPGESVDVTALAELFAQTPFGRRWREQPPCAQAGDWMMRYQVASHRFEARRQTRDFLAWEGVKGLHKDSLSGKEETVATKEWLAQIPSGKLGKDVQLNHLLRKRDPLGAVNLVKRVWHVAYLEAPLEDGGMGLDKRRLTRGKGRGSYFDMPSVPGVAAFPWAREIWSSPEDPTFSRFWSAVEKIDQYLNLQLPKRAEWADESPKDWLARVDWEVFRREFWENQLEEQSDRVKAGHPPEPEWAEAAKEGLAALREFIKDRGCGSPSSYYAVLTGDGDGTGLWLGGVDSEERLFMLEPDFHRKMSEGMAGFAADNTRRIVEDVLKTGADKDHFQGKVIYAGGEDILAILPADQAIACACALRQRYQERMPHREDARFTYSVGIAIGQIKEPLQDLAEAARLAEERAKNALGRNALAVTLFKRSGEIIEWGCRFSHRGSDASAALQLLEFIHGDHRFRPKLDDPTKDPPITGRFPYRLIALLSRYQTYEARHGLPDYSRPHPLSERLLEIAEREVNWTIERQTRKGLGVETDDDLKNLREELQTKCTAFLRELVERHRPLSDFYHLFAIEAFIARQGE